MIIVHGAATGKPSEQRGPTFTGTVWVDPILPRTDDVNIATVFFPPATRTFWHHHERGQILHVTAGSGFVCPFGQKPQPLRAGDTVWVPPGERHWHGATRDSFLTHTAISLGVTQWADEVGEADYASATTE